MEADNRPAQDARKRPAKGFACPLRKITRAVLRRIRRAVRRAAVALPFELAYIVLSLAAEEEDRRKHKAAISSAAAAIRNGAKRHSGRSPVFGFYWHLKSQRKANRVLDQR